MARDANIEAVYPLSPVQQGMLFHLLVDGESGSYVRQITWALPRDLDLAALRRAWERVLDRHAILRTAFVWKSQEEPLQVVLRKVSLPWEEQDWQDLGEDRQEQGLDLLLGTQRQRGFDLTKAPLLRLTLLRTGHDACKLIWTYPQLLLDGWSRLLVQGEILACYQAFREGREPELPPVRPYRDYIVWLRQRDLATAEAYWRRELAGFQASTPLPTRPGTGIWTAAAGQRRERLVLTAALTEELRALARRSHLTLNTLVQGAWALTLACHSGRFDVLFGLTVSGRPADLPGVEGMVGQFVNTVPLRVRISPADAVLPWLRALQAQQADIREHDYAPLVRVQGWSELPAGEPLFESVVAFQNHAGAGGGGEGGKVDAGGLEQLHSFEETGFALDFTVVPGRELSLSLGYHRPRFAPETIRRMLEQVGKLLTAIVAEPETRALELPLLSEGERHQILTEWNDAGPAAADGGLHELFELQAVRAPEAVAVIAGDLRISYAELDRRANRLARRLRELGAGPEALVALVVERSPEMLLGMLGALKAGAAFLPLDPSYPEERLRWVLADATPVVLLAQQSVAARLAAAGTSVLEVEELERATAGRSESPLGLPVLPESLAYVIYTSGSTGRPKGVLVSHRSIVSYTRAVAARLRIQAEDRILQFASPGFDVVVEEVFPAWSRGAAVVIGGADLAASSAGLLEAIRRHGVTALELPTAYWHEWMDSLAIVGDRPPVSLRLLLLGCEQPSARRLQAWQAFGIQVVNIFGLTETTITSCLYELDPDTPIDPETYVMPIGRPIANTRLYLAGPGLAPAPIGAPAELLSAGRGVARGYLGRPDLTAARFLPDPFATEPGARLYRTGDMARWRSDGEVEFLGRVDEQVNIRGFRIELGEIEAQLLRHPGVRQAAVAVRREGAADGRLVAYVVPGEGIPDPVSWRDFLRERLPVHMVPSAFVVLAALPLTPHGKVDRRALPAPDPGAPPAAAEAAPRTPVEQMLADLWSRILGVGRIGRQDDFFALGGHSLLAIRLTSRVRETFGVELPLRRFFEAPTLAALAREIEAALRAGEGRERPRIEPVPRAADADLPLSFAQQRLWFLDQLEPGSSFYNIALALRAAGPLDAGVFFQALGEVACRHEVLRTTFPTVDGEARLRIAPPAPAEPRLVDLSSLPPAVQETVASRLAAAEARRPFDLGRDALLRVCLLRMNDAQHVVLMTLHHIITDEWSMGVLVRELAELYRALLNRQPATLPELAIQYADYAAWQRRWLQGEVLEDELAYWRRKLAGAEPVLALPADRPRPAVQTYRGARRPWKAGPELADSLRAVSRAEGATLFMTLLAAFQVLLGQAAAQEDVCVGSPIAGRSHAEVEGVIGLFVNTLVFRADLAGEPTFRAFLAQVRETALGAYSHQDLPFEKLVDELQPDRDLSHSPLFQVLFTLENVASGAVELPGLSLSGLAVEDPTAKFDLVLALVETPSGLGGSLAWNTDLFDGVTAVRLLDRFNTLLERLASRPDLPLPQLLDPSELERHLVLTEWSQGAVADGRETLLGQLAAQVERSPDATAVIANGVELSYRELDQRSNRLARYLRREGVRPEVLVGVCVERSADMMVGLLGILKAGGAYLPMDPSYPRERLAWMLEDARPLRLLTQQGLVAILPEGAPPALCLDSGWQEVEDAAQEGDEPLAAERLPDGLAYVIFTSGSTGRPKGVQVRDAGLDNFLRFFRRRLELTSGDTFLAVTTLSFDIAALELFLPLCTGARLVIAGREEVLDGYRLVQRLRDDGVTAMQATPSTWRMLVTLDWEGSPEMTLLAGGEALPQDLADLLTERSAVLWNVYGPTETTIWSTFSRVGRGDAVSIGRPIADTQLLLLDRGLSPVPLGVAGGLYLGGNGLARGYLGAPHLTAERFVPHPFGVAPGERLYHTGDLARFDARGRVQFLGRADAQVKVRGFRIELGEIEAALDRHPAVRQAVAVVRGGGSGPRVVAYVVPEPSPAGGAPKVDDMRELLRQTLPDYMIPSLFVVLEALPLTPNGKVDRRALPAPELDRPERYTPARTPAEARLARIWADVLRLDRVGVHDNFFALGGDSILSIQIVARARQAGLHLTPREIFQYQTVAELACRMLQEPASDEEPGRVTPEAEGVAAFALVQLDAQRLASLVEVARDGSEAGDVEDLYPLSPMQRGLLFHALYAPESEVYFEQISLRLEGDFDPGRFRAAWQSLLRRHAILRTSFLWEGLDEPLQVVHRAVELPWQESDWRQLTELERESWLTELLAEDRRRGFDPTRVPLLRASLIRWADQAWQFTWSFHHLLLDGWCLGLIFAETLALYAGHGVTLAATRPYRDYIAWLQRQDLRAAEAYWRETLRGFAAPTPLGLTPVAPGTAEAGSGGELAASLPATTTAQLARLARRGRLTLNTVVQAAWALLLSRHSGEVDVVFGAVVSGRPPELEGVETMLGLFINTLPVRVTVDPHRELLAWMTELQSRQLELRQYEHSPLAQVQGWSDVPPGAPLFDSLLIFENLPIAESVPVPEGGLQVAAVRASERTHYPVTLMAAPGARLPLRLQFDRRRLAADAAARMLGHLQNLLEEISAAPERRLRDVPLLSFSERHQVLVEWSLGPVPAGSESFLELFAAQVERSPDATALVFADGGLSYRELDLRSNQLARYLRRHGIGAEDLVGICVERSAEMVVGLLGILKAGAAYLPMDPAYPRERLNWMLEDGRPSRLLTQERLRPFLPAGATPVLCLDAEWAEVAAESGKPIAGGRLAESLAYVIFTSGSTGRPKGVQVRGSALDNFIRFLHRRLELTSGDVFLAVTTLSFDIAALELFLPLCAGARLEIASREETLDGHALAQRLLSSGVTAMQATPSTWRMLLAEGWEGTRELKVLCGGEALPQDLADLLLERCAVLWNLYGPTETTIWSTLSRVRRGEAVSIGRPLAATQLYLLDRDLSPVPAGVTGDLYLGGGGLARGYLGIAHLTAEKFVPHPLAAQPGDRLYRTGDLARFGPDGTVQFLGRADAQVKVRGFRIELGEIEVALARHPAVQQAVAVLRDGRGGPQVAAYFVPAPAAVERDLGVEELRGFLRQSLPDFMVPSFFVVIPSLPLTPNGKVDRKSLPEPDQEVAADLAAEPHNLVEELLAGIWADVLGLVRVGPHEDFFALGGHSLLATQVVSRVRQIFRVEMPVRSLFDRPTVAGFAGLLAESQGAETETPAFRIPFLSREAHRLRIVPARERGQIDLAGGAPGDQEEVLVFPASFAQQRLWFLDQMDPGGTAYNILHALRLEGDLDVPVLWATFGEVVRRHEVLRTRFATLEGELVQVVEPAGRLAVPLVDLAGLTAPAREQELRRLARQESGEPFDLTRAPLLRVALLRLGEGEHAAFFSIHHIVSDAWSMGLLVREVGQLYTAFSRGLPSPLPELEIQYADYAHWQRQWLQGPVLQAHTTYWKRRLSGEVPRLRLAEATLVPLGSRGGREVLRLSSDLSASLRALARKEGATLFMTLLAGFLVMLRRWCGVSDIAVGTAIANRNRAETEGLIGFLVNMIVLRADLARSATFRDLLAAVREEALGAYAHQDLPFDRLVEEVSRERGRGGSPLFQVAFGLDNAPAGSLDLPGLRLEPVRLEHETARYELTLWMAETSQGLSASWSYHAEILDPAAIARMHEILEAVLDAAVRDPGARLEDLDLAGPDDRARRSEQARMREQAKRLKLHTIKPKAVKVEGAA